MKWEELELHFRGETQQDAPPFGEGVVEWDYSRYTRALGLGRTPGLDTLKRRGCVVAAGRPDFWDEAAGQLEQWSKQRDWRFVRVSARPSTVVPDPVIYHLGIEVTHPDSLIFCGAGQQGKPVLGKRPRSPAMRIPLSPAERWLIAADRVRRRVRAESAMNGLVIFIDDAELLTPNALSILSYLLDAQCAWKSHLLSAPAQIYIVFATQAREEEWFRETLERFSPRAEPFLVKDKVGPRRGGLMPKARLTVEEDHIHTVIHRVGIGLSLHHVRSLFGATSTRAVERLVEVGALHLRREFQQMVVGASRTAQPRATGATTIRATSTVHDSLHAQLSDWPWLVSGVASRCGQPVSSSTSTRGASVLNMAGLGALTPLAIGKGLLGSARQDERPRCESYAAFEVSVAASIREFELARELLLRELHREEWSRQHVPRLVSTLASLGRTVADRSVPSGYWLSLATARPGERHSDIFPIAAELFFDLRRMNLSEINNRYDVAIQLLGHPDELDNFKLTPEDRDSRARVVLLLLRAYRYLFELQSRSTRQLPKLGPVALRTALGQMPGFALGSLAYSELISPNANVEWGRVDTALGTIRDLCLASGCCSDSRVALTRMAFEISRAYEAPRCRELADEAALLFDFDLPSHSKKGLLWLLSALFGMGGRSVYVATHLLSSDRLAATRSGERLSDAQWVAPMLAQAGDVEGALQALMRASTAPGASPYSTLTAIVSRADLYFETLDWGEIEGGNWGDLLKPVTAAAPHLGAFGRHYLMGLRMLRCGRYQQALAQFGLARDALGHPSLGEAGTLYRDACARARECRVLLRTFASSTEPSSAREARDARLFSSLVLTLRRVREQPSYGVLLRGIEDWCVARESVGASAVVSVAMLTLEEWERRGGVVCNDVMGRIAIAAPTLFARAVRALGEGYSIEVPGASEVSQLIRSLRFLAPHWDSDSGGPVAAALAVALRHPATIVESAGLRSQSRKVRTPFGWNEDGALLHGALAAATESKRRPGGTHGQPTTVTMAGVLGRSEVIWHCCTWDVETHVTPRGDRMVWVSRAAASPGRRAESDRRGDTCVRHGAPAKLEHREDSSSALGCREFLGSSPAAVAIRDSIQTAASCRLPILVVGETGTGKGLIAELICDAGLDDAGPMVALNCSAIPDELLEVELFGAKKGAYTGAVEDRVGIIGAASGRTLLLDEVDSMSPRLQAALLRVLDGGEYRRVGDSQVRRARFRLISAASPRLYPMLERGEFRQDLYYRLSTIVVDAPALRQMRDDIAEIAQRIVGDLGATLAQDAIGVLVSREWRGNVRELRNCLEFAVSLSEGRDVNLRTVRLGLRASGGGLRDGDSHHLLADEWHSDNGLLTSLPKRFTTGDVLRLTGGSRRSAQRKLAGLVVAGRLARIGAGRATRYEKRPSSPGGAHSAHFETPG